MKENNKGITLLVLSITIILILIITSTATYYGLSAYHNARLSKFETELKIMQTQVELWEKEEKTELGEIVTEYKLSEKGLLDNETGEIITELSNLDITPKLLTVSYKYISSSTINNLGIDGITQDFLVLIDFKSVNDIQDMTDQEIAAALNNRVISINGLAYKGTTYYTLKALQDAGLVASTFNISGSIDAVASLTNKATGQVTIFSSVQDAVDAAGSNPSIVTLLKDVELVDDTTTTADDILVNISAEKNIILNTNGKKLSYTATPIWNHGTLTIEGEGIISGPCAVRNNGTVNINSGTLSGSSIALISNSGTNNIYGGEIIGTSAGIQNNTGYSSNIYMSGGKITVKKETTSATHISGICDLENSNIEIIGGKIEVYAKTEGASSVRGIYTKCGKLNISGGEIVVNSEGTECVAIGIVNQNGTAEELKITGGNIMTMSADYTSYGIRIYDSASATKLNISGNPTIISKSNSTSFAYGIYNQSSTGDINITGGTIEAISTGGDSYGIYNTVSNSITVGEDDSTISTTSPSITSGTNGVYVGSAGTFNFYDGTIIGGLYTASNKGAIDATIADKPEGYGVYYLTKDNCEVAKLKQGLILNYDVAGYSSATTDTTTWNNRSQNLYHGKLYSNSTESAFGWTDNGLVFDGTDDWVDTRIEDTTEKTARTYAVTFKTNSSVKNQYIISNHQSGGGGIYINSSNKLGCGAYINGTERYCNIGDEPYYTGTIYKAVMTYDGSEMKFYLNKVLKNTTSTIDSGKHISIPTDNTHIALGTNPNGNGLNTDYMFNGTIYSVHVFDKALTQEEVTELYNSEVAKGR